MRVAVLGTGLAGQLAALEIAEAGHDVDIHRTERGDQGLGTIRLGYSFAGAAEPRAVRMLQRGAAAFRPLVERWTGAAIFEEHSSADLVHALPKDGSLTADAARLHFAAVARLMTDPGGPFAFGVESRGWRQLSPREVAGLFDTDHVATAFATREVALDPEALDRALNRQMQAHPRLRFRDDMALVPPTEVGPAMKGYDAVIDARPDTPPPSRRSLLLRARVVAGQGPLPSITRLGGREAGLAAFRDEVRVLWPGLSHAEEALTALKRLAPGLAPDLAPSHHWTATEVHGGTEDALRRCRILSHGHLHRLVAEEPTLAPLLAAEASRRVLTKGANGS